MKRALALTAALLLSSGVAATLEGTYNVTREFPDGKKAETKLKITRTAVALRFEWDGGARVGIGLQVGDHVAVASGGPECGVVAYERRGNTFSGTWTGKGLAKGTETFSWDGQTAARMNVTGTNPDGSAYKGSLGLGILRGFSMLEWQIGQETTYGVGILNEKVFAVAYGGQACVVGLYKVLGDGPLSGYFFQGVGRADLPLREIAVKTVVAAAPVKAAPVGTPPAPTNGGNIPEISPGHRLAVRAYEGARLELV